MRFPTYVWFWLGYEYIIKNEDKNAAWAFEKVLSILNHDDVYYANALASLEIIEYRENMSEEEKERKNYFHSIGETYRYINGKLYFREQPGFRIGMENVCRSEFCVWLFCDLSSVDSLMFDPMLKVGEKIEAKRGDNESLRYSSSGKTVSVPAGKFANCSVYSTSNKHVKAKTVICLGVGIIKQEVTRYGETSIWELSEYNICGGEGMLPFCRGNRWKYVCTSTDTELKFGKNENVFEVTEFNGDTVTMMNYSAIYDIKSKNRWKESFFEVKNNYCTDGSEGGGQHLRNVDAALDRMDEYAETKREKVYSKIARNVMERIFRTDTDYSPECTEVNRWNFFDTYDIKRKGKKVRFDYRYGEDFQWKNGGLHSEGGKILYSRPYDYISDVTECVWDDGWKPGMVWTSEHYGWYDGIKTELCVLENEDVAAAAGEFKNCRVIRFDSQGFTGGLNYLNGEKTYWYAPSVGLVKYKCPINDEIENVWELTEYKGVGDGNDYFPVCDGIVRKYEPVGLGGGYHASVEYTFDGDENGVVVIRNGLGTQDREAYEAEKRK